MKMLFAVLCLFWFVLLPAGTQAAFTEGKTTAKQEQSAGYWQALEQLTWKDYESLTGKHLRLVERVLYRISRRHLQKELKAAQATGVTPEQLLQYYLLPEKGRSGRNVLLIVIIVLLVLLIVPLVLLGKWN